MKNIAGKSTAVLALLLTGACANNGRPAFISDRGVSKEVVDSRGVAPDGDGLLYQFKLAALAAKPYSGSTPALVTNDPLKQRAFMNAGFALIYARCNQYILSKSDNQRRVNVWRDSFAPITALAAGIVSLTAKGDSVDNDILTALALGTTAATAGFKIYEQRYLFGAENVNSVRKLILEALNGDAAKASETKDEKLSYSQAVIHLINNQSVCSPGHILELVNGAIKTGKVESIKGDEDGKPPAESQDKQDLKDTLALIEQLKKDKVLTDAAIKAATQSLKGNPPPVAPPPVATQPAGLEIVTTRIVAD